LWRRSFAYWARLLLVHTGWWQVAGTTVRL
jgi:hypothetical protein